MSIANVEASAGAEKCGGCGRKGFCDGKGLATFKEGSWTSNPVAVQTLGICPTLAVTTRLENSLVMGVAMIFVCVGSSFMLSLLNPEKINRANRQSYYSTHSFIFNVLKLSNRCMGLYFISSMRLPFSA